MPRPRIQFDNMPVAPQEDPSFLDLLKKGEYWKAANKPITDIPSQIAQGIARPLTDWGMNNTGLLAAVARGVGAFGENVGDVASGLTSPLNVALTAGTMGIAPAEQAGYTGLAKMLKGGQKAFATGQVGQGGYNAITGEDNATRLGGAAEAAIGLLGLKGLGKGAPGGPKAPPSAPKTPSQIAQEVVAARSARMRAPEKNAATKYQDQFDTALSRKGVRMDTAAEKATTGETLRDQKNLSDVMKWRTQQDALKTKASETAAAEAEIEAAKEGRDPVTGAPKRTVKAGPESVTTTWQTPEEDAVTTGNLDPAEKALVDKVRGFTKAPLAKTLRPTIPPDFTPPGLGSDIPAFPPKTAPEVPTAAISAPVENIPTREPQVVEPTAEPVGQQQAVPEGVTSESIAAAKAARDAELEAYGAPIAKANDEAIAQKARAGFTVVPPAATPQSPLAQFFKTPVDAVGSAYRAAKGVTGENPLAKQQLGVSLQSEATKAGLPTRGPGDLAKFLETKVSPEISANSAPTAEAVPPNIQALKDEVTARYAGTQEVPGGTPIPQYNVEGGPSAESTVSAETLGKQGIPVPPGAEPDVSGDIYSKPIDERISFIDKLKKLISEQGGGSETGAIDPALLAILGRAGLGAAVGGAMGAPSGHPWEGAIGGGIAGIGAGPLSAALSERLPSMAEALTTSRTGIDKGLQVANKFHNAALLSPLSVVKKFGGDVGGLSTAAIENPERAGALGKAVFGGGLKQAWNVGREAANAPLEEAATGVENVASKGPLSWAGRAMGGLTAGTKDLLGQAGFTPEEQAYYTMTSTPETGLGAAALRAQRSSQAIQHLAPFARLGINRLERGFERSPLGLANVVTASDPQEAVTALKRSLIGTGVMGGVYAATPEDFVKEHPAASSLIAAVGGPMSVPIAAAMALKTYAKSPPAEAAQTISRDVPGLRFIDDISKSPTATLRNYLSGYTNVLRPIAEATGGPGEPDVTGSIFSKALANIPGIRETLPQQPLKRMSRPRIRFD